MIMTEWYITLLELLKILKKINIPCWSIWSLIHDRILHKKQNIAINHKFLWNKKITNTNLTYKPFLKRIGTKAKGGYTYLLWVEYEFIASTISYLFICTWERVFRYQSSSLSQLQRQSQPKFLHPKSILAVSQTILSGNFCV